MRYPLGLSAACAVIGVCLSGCLIHHSSDVSRSGQEVSNATLAQLEAGKTTDQWARAVIGNPTSIQKLENGSEIWKWSYSERKNNHGTVFLLFQSHTVEQEESTVYAEFKDGVLVRWWQG